MAAATVNTGITVPIRTDSDEYRELQETWKEVELRVQRLAQTPVKGSSEKTSLKLGQNLGIEDVLGFVKKAKEYDEEKNAKYVRVEKAVSKTLNCILNIGNIVTTGVSTVFAPAETCYCALTFVIQAWQDYVGIYENLADLLDRCASFLDRMEYYKDRMDVKLTRVAVQHLQLFVYICDQTIQLRKKHSKVAAFARLFLNDNVVCTYLEEMDKLVDKERGLVVAQIFRLASDNAANLNFLVDDKREQKKSMDTKTWRRTIAKTLGFDTNDLDADKEPVARWRTTFSKYKNLLALTEDTGQWILKDRDGFFMPWVASGGIGDVPAILVLNGERGTGKTYMMANVVKHLGKTKNDGSKSVLAYYFLQADSKRTGPQEGRIGALETVSRSLLWQCAVGSEPIMRSVAQQCEKMGQSLDSAAIDTWTQLFLDNPERSRSDTVFYVLIDGLDEEDVAAMMPLLRRLSQDSAKHRLRLFLTTSPSALGCLVSSGVAHRTIDIHGQNNGDIESYIHYRMNQMDILKNRMRPDIEQWWETILTTLRTKADGDYLKIILTLDAISKLDLVEDIQDVLENADKKRTDQIVSEIERLNQTRTPKERMEINAIITWIEGATEWLTVREMEAAVLATQQGVDLSRSLTSLLPFDTKIKTKYPIFKVDLNGFVKFHTEDIKVAIPVKSRKGSAPVSSLHNASQTMVPTTKKITDAEVNIVRHFLATVCPPELYARFDFEEFFARKRDAPLPDTDISQDPDNVHIQVVLASLKALLAPENKRIQAIRAYARANLLSHLEKVDLNTADRALKAEVGPLLVELFTSDVGIDAMFRLHGRAWWKRESDTLCDVLIGWVHSSRGVDTILAWLRDADVVSSIATNTDKGAFVGSFTKPGADLHDVLFAGAARQMAYMLLQSQALLKSNSTSSLVFLYLFLRDMPKLDIKVKKEKRKARNKKKERGGEEAKRTPKENDDGSEELRNDLRILLNDMYDLEVVFGLDQLNYIENWARRVLGRREAINEAIWEVQMVWLLIWCNPPMAARLVAGRFKKAQAIDPEAWFICNLEASLISNPQKSIELVMRAIRNINTVRTKEGAAGLSQEGYNHSLADLHILLGTNYLATEQLDHAVEHYHKSFEYYDTNFEKYVDILYEYMKNEHWSEIIALVETMMLSVDKWPYYFEDLYDCVFENVDLLPLSKAAEALDRWDVVYTLYGHVMRISRDQGAWAKLFNLYYRLGNLLSSNVVRHEAAIVVQWEEATRVSAAHPSDDIADLDVSDMIDELALIYLEQAHRSQRHLMDNVKRESGRLALATTHFGLNGEETTSSELLQKLEALVAIDMPAMWNTPRICVARYHIHRQNLAKARQVIQIAIKDSLDMLSDDDPSNDAEAINCLAKVFSAFADAKNLIAAQFALNDINVQIEEENQKREDKKRSAQVQPAVDEEQDRAGGGSTIEDVKLDHTEDVREEEADDKMETENNEKVEKATNDSESANEDESDLESGDEDENDETHNYHCNGCTKILRYASKVYICSDCPGVSYVEAECYKLFCQGQLIFACSCLCNPTHAFEYVPEWDREAAKAIPKGSLMVGDSIITLEEWKKQIQAQYMDDEALDGKQPIMSE